MTETPVIVTWLDCYSSSGAWKEASDPVDPAVVVKSVGWRLKKYKKGYVVLTDSWFDNDGDLYFGTVTYIPKEMVVSIKKLT